MKVANEALPQTVGAAPADFVQLTADQATKAAGVLKSNWAAAIG